MRIALILLLATVVFAGEEKKTPLERLAGTGVASPAIGYGGTHSEFYEVFRELRESDDARLIARLLANGNPVFRCMGLNLVVDAGKARAIQELPEHIGDRRAVGLTIGCVVSTTTVGGVARRLLHQPRLLGAGERDEPLLPAKTLLALDLNILAREDTFAIHPDAARAVAPRLGSTGIALPRLREQCPGETDLRLVKALGRMGASPGVEAFLLGIAGDADVARNVRLAAVAGVLKGGSAASRKAIVTQQVALLKGTDLAERTVRRDVLEERLHEVFASGKAVGIAEIEKSAAVQKGDPAVLVALENLICDARVNERPVPEWVTPALGRVVARAEAGFPGWDPDADLRYRLESFLWMEGSWLRKHAGSKALEDLAARIAKLVAE